MRLIDADEAGKYLYEHLDDLHMIAAQNAIDEMPTIDAQPVKRGKWEDREVRGSINPYCSNCGNGNDTIYHYDYCPNCGADMRGDKDEAD